VQVERPRTLEPLPDEDPQAHLARAYAEITRSMNETLGALSKKTT
jgi:hypothetical protein